MRIRKCSSIKAPKQSVSASQHQTLISAYSNSTIKPQLKKRKKENQNKPRGKNLSGCLGFKSSSFSLPSEHHHRKIKKPQQGVSFLPLL
ncbi:hypothetical protein RIF29_38196 [Crotalaria pallida]|uniref:Uncharacterized protein n=1 Tax=Crotalaria pallida TaxID=3830 RepID=A0AAN9E0P6_CROPI